MALASSLIRTVILPGEVALFSTLDLVSSFYIVSTPRNLKRVNANCAQVEHLGYLIDGVTGWLGVSVTRALEIVAIGLWLLELDHVTILGLQICTGKLAHVLQMGRPIWSWLACLPLGKPSSSRGRSDGGVTSLAML